MEKLRPLFWVLGSEAFLSETIRDRHQSTDIRRSKFDRLIEPFNCFIPTVIAHTDIANKKGDIWILRTCIYGRLKVFGKDAFPTKIMSLLPVHFVIAHMGIW